jgi:hypothetical protein
MARNRTTFNAATLKKWIAERRGLGHGKDYKPWLKVQNVPSNGYVNRIKGFKTQRRHEFMSNLEASYFYLLEWSKSVTDIREQFPLLPIEETLAIAEQCGIKHPQVPSTNEPVVMTTDFLVDVGSSGSIIERARTIKPAKDLSSDRILAKFEVERRYWLRRNVDWAIVTERDIPVELVKNIEWIHPFYDLSGRLNISLSEISKVKQVLSGLLRSGLALATSANTCDDRFGLEPGTSLALARHFLASRQWRIDMHKPINPGMPIALLEQPAGMNEQYGFLQKHAA